MQSLRDMFNRISSASVAIIAVVVLAGVLRITWLDSVPPAINQDEAIHAWEARCLLKMGCDHTGARWPIFCHAYGLRESHASPFIYLLIPFQWLMGMNVWSTRLPGALAGVVAVPLVYLLVRMWYGVVPALFASLLLAISPWHIHLTRLAFEVSICPTLLLVGMVLVSWGVRRSPESQRNRFLLPGFLVSGMSIGLVLWTYNAYRVFIPIFIGATTVLYARALLGQARTARGRGCMLAFIAGFTIGVAPFAVACVTTPERAWGHAQAEFVLNRENSLIAAIRTGAASYLHQLSPEFLFGIGEPSPIQSIPGRGKLYWICAPMLAAGLIRVFSRWSTEHVGRLLLIWIILAPVPAGLTKLTDGHSLRAATVLPAYQILAALGAHWIIEKSAARSLTLKRATQAVIGTILGISTLLFVRVFFHDYPIACAHYFQSELQPVVQSVMQRAHDYDLVLLTSRNRNQIGTRFLFWSRTEPSEYFSAARNIWEGPEWDVLLQMGKFNFVPYRDLAEIVALLPKELTRVHVLVAERPGVPVDGAVLQKYFHPSGEVAIVLYEVWVNR